VPPGNGFRCGRRSCAKTAPPEQEPRRVGPITVVVAKLCHHETNSTGIIASASGRTLLYFCVHDPAWWWVKASNLGGLSGPVVRFNLAHVFRWKHDGGKYRSRWADKSVLLTRLPLFPDCSAHGYRLAFSSSVHDPAWWWVEASNLRGLSGPVVRFNLAHVIT